MQDSLSPKKVRNGYDVFAKPVVMSQPEETKVKQRQRLLSDDEASDIKAQDSRPPTPPGRLQMGKISSMLQSSYTDVRAVPQRHHSSASRHVREGQPTAMQNGHASCDAEDSQRHQALSSSCDEITPAASPERSPPAVAEVCHTAFAGQYVPLRGKCTLAAHEGPLAILCDQYHIFAV